jgi:hypothetical protein
MSYSAPTNIGSFLVQNTYYNTKPLPGLPLSNLNKLVPVTSATGGNLFGLTGSNVFPESSSVPYAISDFMQLSPVIQGYEQGYKGSVMGPN